ncbi:MAG: formate C-acetyltransferase [Petroclostridium sp.]|jgi:formate C-acetyltransferase|uniref:formate C-acetyltransferase n=1 Tax=Petroclostridium xylanilyticum TaxID=1792311 RepID=UPI000B98A699|nr:formate C-acetyltransferase [Petroclostridium xylanilyticum]MBZ4647108.1 formate acetyltransferase 1 [Clostridia bacterium]MDK2811374.1 formate C-acetyltransferase [Petroclostridium sp.]
MSLDAWKGFRAGAWQQNIDVSNFIQLNYTPYDGDESFLTCPTERTKKLWDKCLMLMELESKKGGVLDIDTQKVTSITSHGPGYIQNDLELIVGLQTESPLKRAINPFGGIRMVKQACEAYGYTLSPDIENTFTRYRTTHNDGVFSAYTDEMKKARKSGIITGLPDAYGRGRIIGDYRRVALYGVDKLIEQKVLDLKMLSNSPANEEIIRLREEVSLQISSLKELKEMAATYGYDISLPASNAKEAIQWTYFAYLGAVKEQNGAAMSLGRINTFFDIFIERDLLEGILTEEQAQELIDQFVIKLRMVRHLRTPEYNELFAGDPVWITEAIGGIGADGRHLVTKTAYRILHTLYNLGPSPEPNLTVLWSAALPSNFKKYCAKVSMDTSSIQYENDDLMQPVFGDDYGIACCVSATRLGKEMQFFGARCNLAKLLLMALNGGKDELTGLQVGPEGEIYPQDYLDYDKIINIFHKYQKWLTRLYVNTMNTIHYMHDKYAYEKLQMALIDTPVNRNMAFGIAGLSVVADSLSAIKYAKVKAIRNAKGLITDFEIEGDFPKYGNNDDRVDNIAVELVKNFILDLQEYPTYRNAKHTLSILTITSNVVYGKKTGSTPDGRKKGEPFAPGANPLHGRDQKGLLAVLNSCSKLPYEYCRDGISVTITIVPKALGNTLDVRVNNLCAILDGYFSKDAHHLNVNIIDKEILLDAMNNPGKYPQLTVRVSGYAVHFNKLNRYQQEEVIMRTFYDRV